MHEISFILHFLESITHPFHPCSLCIIISLELLHVMRNLTVMIVIQVQQPFWLFLFDPSCHNLFFWQRYILCLTNILLIIGCQKGNFETMVLHCIKYVARSIQNPCLSQILPFSFLLLLVFWVLLLWLCCHASMLVKRVVFTFEILELILFFS